MDRIDSMLERVSPPPARTKQSATPSRTVYIARSQPSPTVGSPPAAKVRYVCVSEATTQMHMHAHAITRRLPHSFSQLRYARTRAHGHLHSHGQPHAHSQTRTAPSIEDCSALDPTSRPLSGPFSGASSVYSEVRATLVRVFASAHAVLLANRGFGGAGGRLVSRDVPPRRRAFEVARGLDARAAELRRHRRVNGPHAHD